VPVEGADTAPHADAAKSTLTSPSSNATTCIDAAVGTDIVPNSNAAEGANTVEGADTAPSSNIAPSSDAEHPRDRLSSPRAHVDRSGTSKQ
jgi:hypothetical protein